MIAFPKQKWFPPEKYIYWKETQIFSNIVSHQVDASFQKNFI